MTTTFMKQITPKILLMILGLFGLLVLCSFQQDQKTTERKTKRVSITEVMYISRGCPDDVVGSYPENAWQLTELSGEEVTVTCSYLDWDDGK
jgi:hypothetical protein